MTRSGRAGGKGEQEKEEQEKGKQEELEKEKRVAGSCVMVPSCGCVSWGPILYRFLIANQ